MRDIEIPNGIAAVGYRESDIGDLVDGTMKPPARVPAQGVCEDALR